MIEATTEGRWGIRQVKDGVPTGGGTVGGTVGWGWATREEAEAANPYRGGLELEVYDRFGGGGSSACRACHYGHHNSCDQPRCGCTRGPCGGAA